MKMRHACPLPAVLALFGGVPLPGLAVGPGAVAPTGPTPARESTEWCDAWSQPADKNDLPRVLLIGDSISRGYHGQVVELLKGRAYVDRLSTSYSIGDGTLHDTILAQVRNHRFAVIHLNNGLHGSAYAAGAYEAGMRQLIIDIHAANPDAKLVLATSTFVLPGYGHGKPDDFHRQMIADRNAALLKLGKEFSLPVNDLAAVTHDHPELYQGDKIHYNGKGYAALGKQVADGVAPLLPVK